MKKVCFSYKVNQSKLDKPEVFIRQVRAVLKRIGKKVDEISSELGYNGDDFMQGKITLIICYFEEL